MYSMYNNNTILLIKYHIKLFFTRLIDDFQTFSDGTIFNVLYFKINSKYSDVTISAQHALGLVVKNIFCPD